jgi:hypothetical protein
MIQAGHFRLSIEIHSSVLLSGGTHLLLNTVRSEKPYNSAKHMKTEPGYFPPIFTYTPWDYWYSHRLNMELDLQSALLVLYSLAEIPQHPTLAFGLICGGAICQPR